MQLTPRLEAAVSLIPKGSVIADIGRITLYPGLHCERGVPCHCRRYRAGPLSGGQGSRRRRRPSRPHRLPSRRRTDLCRKRGSRRRRHLRHGRFFDDKILQQSYDVWQSFDFVVLQPQSDSGDLRRYLYEKDWHIEDERLVIDDGRLYELLRAVPGKAEALPEWQYELGPVNWQRRNPLLSRKIEILMETKGRNFGLASRRAAATCTFKLKQWKRNYPFGGT